MNPHSPSGCRSIRPGSAWLILALLLSAVAPQSAIAQLGGLFAGTPAVPEISIDQLKKVLADHDQAVAAARQADQPSPPPGFVLIDARSAAETDVSLIPGAITIAQYETDADALAKKQVIVYCTSGYRSHQYAAKLIEKGIAARNFKGSILAWCAAEGPLVTPDGKPTRRVHTYSSRNRVPASYQAVH